MTKKTKSKNKKKNNIGLKIVSIVFIIASIVILANVLKRVYNVFSLQKQAEVVEQELQKLKDENASLISTKEKLEDPDYVQTYAGGEYMFSKGDEKIFYLPTDED